MSFTRLYYYGTVHCAIKKRPKAYFYCFSLSLIGKAIAAINGAVISWLERHLAVASARGANGVKKFTLTSAATVVFPRITTGLTSLRLIGETSFFEEILFTCRENEFLIAIPAHYGLVLMNQLAYLFDLILLYIRFAHTLSITAIIHALCNNVKRIYCATGGDQPCPVTISAYASESKAKNNSNKPSPTSTRATKSSEVKCQLVSSQFDRNRRQWCWHDSSS